MVQKFVARGPRTLQWHSEKVTFLEFRHFGPFLRWPVPQTCRQKAYDVLYYVRSPVDLRSLAFLAHTVVAEM